MMEKKGDKMTEEKSVQVVENKPIVDNNIKPTELKKMLEVQKENRKLLLEYVESQLKEGSDYHIIKNKKSLGKPGAEKFCSLFNITIGETEVDQDTFERLPQEVKDKGAIVLKVKLYRNGEYIGSGVGARTLTQDNGDLNKAMKMAKKSAIIDAVLSTFGLSDLFTQDIEDMPHIGETDSKTIYPPSEAQIKFLKDLLMKKKGMSENSADIKAKSFKDKEEVKVLIDNLIKLKNVKPMDENEENFLESMIDDENSETLNKLL